MRKLLAVIGVAALCAAVVIGATASSAGAKRGRAETKVTIQKESDGFFGYVKSKDGPNCENNRKVILYKQLGSTQDPHNDKKIGTDLAQPNGPHAMWQTGNTGSTHGLHYAHVKRTDFCFADSSPSV
jgi:hypothetical protein